MADIAGKIATQAITKAVEKSQEGTQAPKATGDAFSKMLQNAQGDFDFANMLGVGNNKALPTGKVESLSAEGIPFDAKTVTHAEGSTAGQKVVGMLSDFNQQQSQMDTLVNQILHSEKKFSNQELLAIQSHVYHLAQMTELTVKSVELGVTSFRGIMNTQVQ